MKDIKNVLNDPKNMVYIYADVNRQVLRYHFSGEPPLTVEFQSNRKAKRNDLRCG